ncbi:MAG TPA: hypothetical protein ENK04_09650 [Gammaproteobacteria bacterium]|nr:hypothetical protein [Gammaproteobacteria bacterium]
MDDLIFKIIAGIIVAVLTWSIPKALEWLQVKRNSQHLQGAWISRYQSIDNPDYFYNETVTVDVSFLKGKIKFVNSNCREGYLYNAFCLIVDRNFISGQWVSTKKGASACGCVSLIVGPHGNIMYGYWSGYNEEGGRNYGKWILGRTQDDLDIAMGFLEK